MTSLPRGDEAQAKLALIGFRQDENSSYMKGASEAPPQIRAAFRSEAWNLTSENGTELESVFFDAGDVEALAGGAALRMCSRRRRCFACCHADTRRGGTRARTRRLPPVSKAGLAAPAAPTGR